LTTWNRMLTYSHAVIGYLSFVKGSSSAKKQAVLGSITPDLLLATGFLFQTISFAFDGSTTDGIHMAVHSAPLPQAITDSLHSIVVVAPIAIIVIAIRKSLFPFFAGIFLHIAIDFLTHQKWPYNHLYPIDAEPVIAVFSYWSPRFMAIEHGILLVLVALYIQKKRTLVKQSTQTP